MSKQVYRCMCCDGTNVQLAFWANPNTRTVEWAEPLFEAEEKGDQHPWQAQWCLDCDADHGVRVARERVTRGR